MTSQNAIAEAPRTAAGPVSSYDPETMVIETRFGSMEFQLQNTIVMPRGMLGYADHHDFGLANMPDPKLANFKLFQSLDEPSLSFVVTPFNPGPETIDVEDIGTACDALSINPVNAITLLVVSTRQVGPATEISVNLRAPIIIDGRSQKAYQHVLMNNRYPVRQVIGTAAKSAS